jgi:hypothetical protein
MIDFASISSKKLPANAADVRKYWIHSDLLLLILNVILCVINFYKIIIIVTLTILLISVYNKTKIETKSDLHENAITSINKFQESKNASRLTRTFMNNSSASGASYTAFNQMTADRSESSPAASTGINSSAVVTQPAVFQPQIETGLSEARATFITNKLCNLIINQSLPIDIINSPEFLEFTAALNSQYTVPSGRAFVEQIIPSLIERANNAIRDKLADLSHAI